MSLRDVIAAANKQFMAAYDGNGGDMTALSNLYTDDCKIMPAGAETMEGRASVAAVFGSVWKEMNVRKVVLTIQEVGPLNSEDMAFERSTYEFFDEKGTTLDKGKYVVVWKKVDGKWYLYTDIFNTSESTQVDVKA